MFATATCSAAVHAVTTSACARQSKEKQNGAMPPRVGDEARAGAPRYGGAYGASRRRTRGNAYMRRQRDLFAATRQRAVAAAIDVFTMSHLPLLDYYC